MSQLGKDLVALIDRRRVLAGLAAGVGAGALAACGSKATAQSAQGNCLATPTETRGPFPADGVGGRGRLNVLNVDGVIRRDIRSSFAGLAGRAEGVPLELEIQLAREGGCDPLAGRALYLWQNDAEGIYSLYNRTDVNYLRGLQSADAQGRVRFTSIVPGCYGGRYPHCHFEVFESVEAATGGAAPLLVSQLAFPAGECARIYRSDARYGESLANLAREPIDRDFVFADSDAAGRARQTVTMSGSAASGYRGTATVELGS